jgi:uncharacterized protein
MKQIFALLTSIVLTLAALPARAEEEVPRACEGRNLFEVLKASEPAKLAELQKEADATPNARNIYWKITPKNGAKPSYLLGTIHVTETRINTLDETIKDRIRKSKVLALELREIANKEELQAAFAERTDLSMMPEGKTLWDVVPDEEEAKVRANPALALVPDQVKAQFKPWMLGVMAASPVCEQLRATVKQTFDETLADVAAEANVEIVGLEKVDEQLNAIAGIPMGEQVKMLIASVSAAISAEDGHRTMVELYLDQNIAIVMPLFAYIGKTDAFSGDVFMDRLVDKRNALMADRAQPLIDSGDAFIAVGALHLPGKEGVVERLRRAGNVVEAVE